MTKIYIYCLFDGRGSFHGVYSSVDASHRDAIKLCNKGPGNVLMEINGNWELPSTTKLRNLFKGACDVQVRYSSGAPHQALIIKTKLKE